MPAKPPHLLESPTVAIVDDDESVRQALCDLLAAMDIECREFERAEAFLMEFQAGAFDCVMTDVRMPGLNGLDLQDRLRVLDATMTVIFLSADTSAATRDRALKGGAVAYLIKPVSDDNLFAHLKAALGRGRNPGVRGWPDE
jgi:two-component system, LuxR family, response regulator FixJ